MPERQIKVKKKKCFRVLGFIISFCLFLTDSAWSFVFGLVVSIDYKKHEASILAVMHGCTHI